MPRLSRCCRVSPRQCPPARNIPITNADGSGVTDAATLDLAVRASSRVAHLIIEGLTQNALKCALTNAVRALPVGIIRGVETTPANEADVNIAPSIIPDEPGEVYADRAYDALAVEKAIEARGGTPKLMGHR